MLQMYTISYLAMTLLVMACKAVKDETGGGNLPNFSAFDHVTEDDHVIPISRSNHNRVAAEAIHQTDDVMVRQRGRNSTNGLYPSVVYRPTYIRPKMTAPSTATNYENVIVGAPTPDTHFTVPGLNQEMTLSSNQNSVDDVSQNITTRHMVIISPQQNIDSSFCDNELKDIQHIIANQDEEPISHIQNNNDPLYESNVESTSYDTRWQGSNSSQSHNHQNNQIETKTETEINDTLSPYLTISSNETNNNNDNYFKHDLSLPKTCSKRVRFSHDVRPMESMDTNPYSTLNSPVCNIQSTNDNPTTVQPNWDTIITHKPVASNLGHSPYNDSCHSSNVAECSTFDTYQNFSDEPCSPQPSTSGAITRPDTPTGDLLIDLDADAEQEVESAKDRRRESNKQSAQAYRERRKLRLVEQEHTLKDLERKNQRLVCQLTDLKRQRRHVITYLREHWGFQLPPSSDEEMSE